MTFSGEIAIEAIEEDVEVVSEARPASVPSAGLSEHPATDPTVDSKRPSWPVRFRAKSVSAAEWLFGLASMLIGLSFISAIPVLQFLSLGYLLEASGRVARTGRLAAGFVGVRPAARVGSLVLGTWLLLWPLRLLSDFWYSAQLIAERSPSTVLLRITLVALTVLFIANVLMAWIAGGKLRHFFWPLVAPLFLGMWALRRVVASNLLRPIVRPLVGSISPRLLTALTTVPALSEWFPPVILYVNLRRGGLYARSRDAVWEFFVGLRLAHYFSLGVRGFVGAVLWLFIPAAFIIGVTKVPATVSILGGSDGLLRLATTFSAFVGLYGAALMGIVLLYLPFLQTHFAAENRFAAMFELQAVRSSFRRAPLAYGFALLITFLFALPLFLLKIEYTYEELLWIPGLVFVVFIYPARLLTGWALGRGRKRDQPRWLPTRLLVQFLEIPIVLFYVLVLFFTQYVSWSGSWSVLEQPPFLLPAPFFFGL